MKNKKVAIFIAVILCITLSSCSYIFASRNENISDSSYVSQPEHVVGFSSSSLSFDDAVLKSYLIIKGTMRSKEDNIIQSSDESKGIIGSICEFDNLEVIKGDYQKESITVRISNSMLGRNDNIYEKGKDFILLLSRSDIVYDGEERYYVYGYSIDIDGSRDINIHKGDTLIEHDVKKADEFGSYLNSILEKHKNTETEVFNVDTHYCKSDKASDIVETADIILKVEIVEQVIDGGYTIYAKCKVINTLKGDIEKEANIIFFKKDFKLNTQYLVLLSDLPSGYYHLSSQNSCIPISDTEKYEEYMSYINK